MSSHRIPPKPDWFETTPPGTCRWCNEEVGLTPKGKPSKSRWHQTCLTEYKLIFWPGATRRAVWKRDTGRCAKCSHICEKKGIDGWHMDHIVPLIESNGDIKYWTLPNLQTLCKRCHAEKTSREATERAKKRRMTAGMPKGLQGDLVTPGDAG